MGRPVDVIESPLTGLPIPAGAEIVLEGWLYPDKLHKEGPYRGVDRLLFGRPADGPGSGGGNPVAPA